MTERFVQVPVSLIEEAADLIESDRGEISTARQLRALLSQPTPSAGPMQTCGVCGRKYPAADTRATCPVCWPGFGEYTAEPPRIEGGGSG